MDLSIIVPVYNEEESVESLVQETRSALASMGKDYEIIVVDDGSTDGTYPILSRLHKGESKLKVIRFKRNFGQTAALAAGLANARGEVIVSMDGDGQSDPEDIPLLLRKLEEGFDLVNGWRFPRRDPFWSRRVPSQIANGIISWLTQVKLHDFGCTLKAIRRDIAKDLKLLLFNMLSRLVITFLSRSKYLLISWLQSPSAVILELPKNKVCQCFPSYLP